MFKYCMETFKIKIKINQLCILAVLNLFSSFNFINSKFFIFHIFLFKMFVIPNKNHSEFYPIRILAIPNYLRKNFSDSEFFTSEFQHFQIFPFRILAIPNILPSEFCSFRILSILNFFHSELFPFRKRSHALKVVLMLMKRL